MLLRPRVQLIGSTLVINNSVSQDSVKLKAFFRVLGDRKALLVTNPFATIGEVVVEFQMVVVFCYFPLQTQVICSRT